MICCAVYLVKVVGPLLYMWWKYCAQWSCWLLDLPANPVKHTSFLQLQGARRPERHTDSRPVKTVIPWLTLNLHPVRRSSQYTMQIGLSWVEIISGRGRIFFVFFKLDESVGHYFISGVASFTFMLEQHVGYVLNCIYYCCNNVGLSHLRKWLTATHNINQSPISLKLEL